MKTTLFIVTVISILLLSIGFASAEIDLTIKTDTGDVQSGDTLYLEAGYDAFFKQGLRAEYTGDWTMKTMTNTGLKINQHYVKVTEIQDLNEPIVYLGVPVWEAQGPYPVDGDHIEEIHWKPQTSDVGKFFEIEAYGSQWYDNGKQKIYVYAYPVITPELPTSALMSVGLIGLFGMVYLRRKN